MRLLDLLLLLELYYSVTFKTSNLVKVWFLKPSLKAIKITIPVITFSTSLFWEFVFYVSKLDVGWHVVKSVCLSLVTLGQSAVFSLSQIPSTVSRQALVTLNLNHLVFCWKISNNIKCDGACEINHISWWSSRNTIPFSLLTGFSQDPASHLGFDEMLTVLIDWYLITL